MRKTEFANGEYYHIYNRGVDKREVFLENADYFRFLKAIKVFNQIDPTGSLRIEDRSEASRKEASLLSSPPLVDFIAYCLNPNHYHFIVKQLEDRGVEKFMHKLGTSYTKYFNHKNDRSGVLFQGPFKSVHIDSNKYLLLLSAYVNANHRIHNYPEINWPYSSYLDYIGKRNGKLCQKEVILRQFNNDFDEYKNYVKINADYFKDKKEEKKYVLED